MAKLIVALSLLVGGANAMGIYGTGRPTAEPTGGFGEAALARLSSKHPTSYTSLLAPTYVGTLRPPRPA